MLMQDQMESKVGKKLSEITTRRVIILVLAMLFSQPIFSVSTYMQQPNSFDYGLNLIQQLGPETKGGKAAFQSMIEIQKVINTPLKEVYIFDYYREDKNKNDTYTWKAEGFVQEEYREKEKTTVILPVKEGDQ